MKLIFCIVLFCLFSICLSQTDAECSNCIEIVNTVGAFCTKQRGCNQNSAKKFLEETCGRFWSVDKQMCQRDSQLLDNVWSLIDGQSTASEICRKAEICPKKINVMGYLKNDNYGRFVEFKTQFNRKYENSFEESRRAFIFYNNLARIEKLNKYAQDNKLSTKFGINDYADKSFYEFKLGVLSHYVAVPDSEASGKARKEVGALPENFDWQSKGAVTPVKNQGQCGSCWSFSTTGNIEGQWFLSGHTLVGLSEQNLVDCDHECMMYENQQTCDAGCDGGLMPNAFTYVIKNKGIDTEASYPYTAVDGTCSFNAANVGATITNFTMISHNETDMQEYLYAHGPVSIAADAAEWQFYIGGVFDFPCGTTLDHGILITGYGIEVDILGFHIPYWWVKNSWGGSWGEKGYLKIKRGDCKCGLCLFPCSSIV